MPARVKTTISTGGISELDLNDSLKRRFILLRSWAFLTAFFEIARPNLAQPILLKQ